MARKKKEETIMEKAQDAVKEIADEAKEIVEETVSVVKDTIENVIPGSEEKSKKAKSKSKSNDSETEDKKAKLAKLLEKAKKLESSVEEVKDVDLKSKVKDDDSSKETLVPMDDYLKSSIHIGTRVITPDMRKYVYRRRADGLAVFNTALLDNMIREGADYLSKYSPSQVLLICKREAGWMAVKKFSEITGVKIFTKKYPAGILTNTTLDNFMETDLVFICDPWLDKNALEDANRIRIPVLSICDTNNFTKGIDKIIPGNNKSAKSLGMILYLLAKIYCEKHKIEKEFAVTDFIEGWDDLLPPK